MKRTLGNPTIRQLAGNPLLLTLMAVLARTKDLPHDLLRIYEEATDLLLEHWDSLPHAQLLER